MAFNRKIIYKGKSDYGSYKVIDMTYSDRQARVLFGDKGSAQSGMALDDGPELLFDYIQRFLEIMISHQYMQRALIIGGGAGTLPAAAYHHLPTLAIDVVEIDPLLTQLAYRYFNLPKSSRLKVYNQDGAVFVSTTTEKYNMICLDAFSGYTIPPHLLRLTTLKDYKRCLAKDGFIIVNFISEYKPYQQKLANKIISLFSRLFSSVSLYQADHREEAGEDQNFILVASDKPVSFDYLQSIEREIYK